MHAQTADMYRAWKYAPDFASLLVMEFDGIRAIIGILRQDLSGMVQSILNDKRAALPLNMKTWEKP
ncbi:hypothetical protein [Nitrosomonas sp. wSCUT-2]